jgi:hypothetical protein
MPLIKLKLYHKNKLQLFVGNLWCFLKFAIKAFKMFSRHRVYFLRHNLEAFIWITALVVLALSNPSGEHYSLCPFHNLGWEHCLGCGLGRSVSLLFRGELSLSIRCHPLGLFAIVMIISRIIQVFKNTSNNYKAIYKSL